MVFVFPEGIDDVFVGVRVLFVEAVRNKAHPIAGISFLTVRIVLCHGSVLRMRPKANVQLTALQQDARSHGFAAIAGKAASLRTN